MYVTEHRWQIAADVFLSSTTDGLRTQRTNGTKTYNYVYNGTKLSQMTVSGKTLNFTYDANGSPMTVEYLGATYYYVTNLQGDVDAILDGNGNYVVKYFYNAWGGLCSTVGSRASTLGVDNPLRYRAYVYDHEYGLYYLQSRYYDPYLGRFINADGLVSTGEGIQGYNMFAYCNNNPIMGYDPTGLVNWGGVAAGVGIGILSVFAIAATVATAGAASPLLAAVGSAVGMAMSAALVEASVVTTVGAVQEAPIVYDVTVTNGHDKIGCSLVYDFGANTTDIYLHEGVQSYNDYGATFGSGFVFNYDSPGDYAGEFYDVSYSTNVKGANVGIDGCTDPQNLQGTTSGSSAILFTSGLSASISINKGPNFSYDYYWQVAYY